MYDKKLVEQGLVLLIADAEDAAAATARELQGKIDKVHRDQQQANMDLAHYLNSMAEALYRGESLTREQITGRVDFPGSVGRDLINARRGSSSYTELDEVYSCNKFNSRIRDLEKEAKQAPNGLADLRWVLEALRASSATKISNHGAETMGVSFKLIVQAAVRARAAG